MRNANVVTLNSASTIADFRMITNSSLVIAEGAAITIRASTTGSLAVWRGAMNSTQSTVTMNGGSLMIARSVTYATTMTIAQASTGYTANTTGSFIQNTGTVYVNGMISIASNPGGTAYTASGLYQLNGGTLYLHTSTPTVSAGGYNYVGFACGIESQRNQSSGLFQWTGGTFSANYLRDNLTNTGSGKLPFDTVVYSTDTSNNYATYGQATAVNSIGRMAITDFSYSGTVYSAVVTSNLVYTQGASASMAIDIAGTGAGQYDQLRWVAGSTTSTVAGGTVNLAAGTTIAVNITEGTTLHSGDTFYIVLAGTAINITGGTLSSIVLSGIDAANFELALTTTTLSTNSYGDAFAGTAMYKGADSITVKALTLTYYPRTRVGRRRAGFIRNGFRVAPPTRLNHRLPRSDQAPPQQGGAFC